MPPASTTTQKVEIVRNRRERPGMLKLAEIIARNDRPRPVAARSCNSTLTGIGMRPTMQRWSPAEVSEPRKSRDVRRLVPAGSATLMSTP